MALAFQSGDNPYGCMDVCKLLEDSTPDKAALETFALTVTEAIRRGGGNDGIRAVQAASVALINAGSKLLSSTLSGGYMLAAMKRRAEGKEATDGDGEAERSGASSAAEVLLIQNGASSCIGGVKSTAGQYRSSVTRQPWRTASQGLDTVFGATFLLGDGLNELFWQHGGAKQRMFLVEGAEAILQAALFASKPCQSHSSVFGSGWTNDWGNPRMGGRSISLLPS